MVFAMVLTLEGVSMKNGLKTISCDPVCGFMVRSHNEQEVIDMAMEHMANTHPKQAITGEDLKKMIK
jgi:predicted small metal-binding protein